MEPKWRNFDLERKLSINRKRILLQFPHLLTYDNYYYQSFIEYIDNSPQRFYNNIIYYKLLNWMMFIYRLYPTIVNDFLVEHYSDYNNLYIALNEVNKYPWHDQIEITYDDEIIRIIDRDIHQLYLRLLEQVYYYFVLLISFVNRKVDGKGTEGLDLFNAVEDIKISLFPELADYYKHTIRNGIAHGKFTYYDHAIVYRDKNEEVKAEAKEIIEYTDDLLDLCNGMALSLHMFFLYYKSEIIKTPQQLLLKEIQLETGTPWWIVNSYLQSEIIANRQIIIYPSSIMKCNT
jgi:hypothetical protein